MPAGPDTGDRLVMFGAGTVTLKLAPLLGLLPTATITFPVVAPSGTGATMLVALQLVGVARAPLNFTVLVPAVVPKLAPVIVTAVPVAPDSGLPIHTS